MKKTTKKSVTFRKYKTSECQEEIFSKFLEVALLSFSAMERP